MKTIRFAYATFKTRLKAELALEEMFANGEVCTTENPVIELLGKRFAIMLPEWTPVWD